MPDSTKKHQIQVQSQGTMPNRGIFVDGRTSLLANLIENQIDIDHSCGGNGTCGTCRVQVLEGHQNISEVEEIEADMILDRKFDSDERLSCQSFIKGPVKIKIV